MAFLLKNLYSNTFFTRCQRVCTVTKQSYFSTIVPASSQLVNNPNLLDYISDKVSTLWDGLLLAAPKKRRSIAKRRHLRKFKQLTPRNDIEDCVVCGNKKLMDRLCKNCFHWTMSLTEKVWEETGKNKKDRYVR